MRVQAGGYTEVFRLGGKLQFYFFGAPPYIVLESESIRSHGVNDHSLHLTRRKRRKRKKEEREEREEREEKGEREEKEERK